MKLCRHGRIDDFCEKCRCAHGSTMHETKLLPAQPEDYRFIQGMGMVLTVIRSEDTRRCLLCCDEVKR